MKITVRELKNIILEAVLKEADLRRVSRRWIGTYAFILAYNAGLAEGLFPRTQRMDIEFDYNNPSSFRNGTLYLNPRDSASKDFFTSGAGHDMLHGITQNSQPHFGTYKGGETENSTNNAMTYRARNTRRAFDQIKQRFGLDLAKIFPKIAPSGEASEVQRSEIIGYLTKRYIQDKKGMFPWEEIRNQFEDMTRRGNYYSNNHMMGSSNSNKTNNPTHAIEEEIGNVVSDTFADFLISSTPITPDALNSMFRVIDSWTKPTEFKFYSHPTNDNTIARWKMHMHQVLGRFTALYNAKLAILNKSNMGLDL